MSVSTRAFYISPPSRQTNQSRDSHANHQRLIVESIITNTAPPQHPEQHQSSRARATIRMIFLPLASGGYIPAFANAPALDPIPSVSGRCKPGDSGGSFWWKSTLRPCTLRVSQWGGSEGASASLIPRDGPSASSSLSCRRPWHEARHSRVHHRTA